MFAPQHLESAHANTVSCVERLLSLLGTVQWIALKSISRALPFALGFVAAVALAAEIPLADVPNVTVRRNLGDGQWNPIQTHLRTDLG